MTKSQDGVDPPFSKRSVQLTVIAFVLSVSLCQLVAVSRLARKARASDEVVEEARRWGELSGTGHPLIQIDLNRAGPRELSLLPGVGPILADRIVANRERLGPFATLESLTRVHGIGAKTIDLIRVIAYVEPVSCEPRRAEKPVRLVGRRGIGGGFVRHGSSARMLRIRIRPEGRFPDGWFPAGLVFLHSHYSELLVFDGAFPDSEPDFADG